MINPLKALLFLAGGTTVAGVGAYVSGALDPYFNPQQQPPAAVANLPAGTAEPTVAVTTPDPAAPKEDRVEQPANTAAPTDQAAAPTNQAAAPTDQAAATPDQPAAGADTPPTTEQQPQAPEIAALDPQTPATEPQTPAAVQPDTVSPGTPTFDIVRVEPDGSVVIAGRAAANATIELLTGGNVIGTGKAGAGGDFVIVLDKPLAPGDYEITIRATNPDSTVVASAQTAIVSVPKEQGGAVLAMVEEPGKPSEIITVPEPVVAAADAKPTEAAPAAPEPDATKPADTATAAADPAQQPGASTAEPAKPAIDVAVEAVEIEGRKIFVAGRAPAGVTVRAYADDDALGEAKASPAGRFLVEAQRELAVGNHVVRVDVLGPDGVQVIARAAVPFEREAGENVAAVAAPAEDTQPGAPATTDQPAATTTAPAAVAEDGAPAAGAGQAPAATAEQQPATGEQASPSAQAPAVTADAPAATQPADAAPADPKPAAVAAATPPADGVTAPALQNVKSAVIIRRGDSLWRISKRVYGRGVRYSTIYLANQDQIRDPDMIWPGQVFTVPNKTDEGEAADMTRIGEQATSKTE